MPPGDKLGRKRAKVVDALKKGGTRHAVAKRLGIPKSTVQTIAADEGIDARPEAKQQTQAARDFNREAQIHLMNKLAAKIDELLPGADKLGAVRDAAVAGAIVVDKRRLIDGEATERTETHALSTLASRIAGLAERSRKG